MKTKFVFILIIFFILSACRLSSLVNTPTPVFTQTPIPTETFVPTGTPVLTETLAPTEIPVPTETPVFLSSNEPYAIIASDKAHFWFPLPPNKEWKWLIARNPTPTSNKGIYRRYQWIWEVKVPTTDHFNGLDFYMVRSYYQYSPASDYQYITQTGRFEELFQLMENDISKTEDRIEGELGMTSSIFEGGLLFELTNPYLLERLNTIRPPALKFFYPGENVNRQVIDVIPTYR